MRVLVTGGAGFLGSHLTDALLARGDEVVVFDDLSRGSLEQVGKGARFEQGDVRLESDWKRVCSNFSPDVIHHLAAVNGTRRFHREADLVVDVNINGTRNALAAAKSFGSRLIFYSSPESFGEQETMPLSNDSDSLFTPAHLHQRHSYGASKYLDEVACQHAARDGLDVRIVRPFNVYGPRLLGDEYGQVVAMFFQAILSNGTVQLHNGGNQTRSFTWIDDAVEGFILAGLQENSLHGASLSGCALNIGTTAEITIRDLQETIFSMVSNDASWKNELPEVEVVSGYHGDAIRRLPDCSQAEAFVGWKPKVSLEQGLLKMWSTLR